MLTSMYSRMMPIIGVTCTRDHRSSRRIYTPKYTHKQIEARLSARRFMGRIRTAVQSIDLHLECNEGKSLDTAYRPDQTLRIHETPG